MLVVFINYEFSRAPERNIGDMMGSENYSPGVLPLVRPRGYEIVKCLLSGKSSIGVINKSAGLSAV